ncbi:probable Bax inhibitor 1 [Lingula anatina]|uniref:Probable Bax inhibitor 1 n=1 Tax=Lingula anatina TaxID=7574 RepID=A0A1S3HKX4_LINAN|nr:probable Bax inhibitor 1 [Lingula anatina]|eukprot:XP_013386111.1 probable Bax inhibitor 1 [Lingula anatina]
MADADFNAQVRTLFDFSRLEKPVQLHLKNVYSCLAICMLAAAVGGYVHVFTGLMQAGLLTLIGVIGLMIALSMTANTPENQPKRLAMLGGFAFFSGMSLGPLLDVVIEINPSIIPTAFLGTCVIFACFSLSALLAGDQRKYLYLGGMLFSGLSIMMLMSLVNLLLGIRLIFELNLYLGLIIMCGFVLYDTQLIVEKRRRGDTDFIWHSVDLFLDFINIFRRLLIILASKEDRKKNKN